jgi:hypothetical protein
MADGVVAAQWNMLCTPRANGGGWGDADGDVGVPEGDGGGFAASDGGDNRGAGEGRGSTSQMARRAQRAGCEQGKAPPSKGGLARAAPFWGELILFT